jgi:V/A-type H+-transporting ATPase subunit A
LSAIGAVSPPGGDISEPVSQATLRIVKVFWSLDANLAYRRHFPAVNWLTSYSLYNLGKWFDTNVNGKWTQDRDRIMKLLNDEAELDEIVKLVGMDALSAPDRLKLEAARSIREDFLHQDAFHEVDTYTDPYKQFLMMELVLDYYDAALDGLDKGAAIDDLVKLPVRERIGRIKYVDKARMESEFDDILSAINSEISALLQKEEA